MGYKTNIMVSSEFLVGSLPRHLVAIFGYILVSDIFLYLYPLIRWSDRSLSAGNDTYLVLENKLDTKLNDPSLEYLPVNDNIVNRLLMDYHVNYMDQNQYRAEA